MRSVPVWASAGGAVLLALAIVFGQHPHPHVWWEEIPAYAAVFGYAGAWLLIGLAKSVLAPLLRREPKGETW